MTKSILASRSIRALTLFGALVCIPATLLSQTEDSVYFQYSAETGWTAGNGQFRARFKMEPDATFHWVDFSDGDGKVVWRTPKAAPSSPIDLRIGNNFLNAKTQLRLVREYGYELRNWGRGWVIVFQDLPGHYEIELHLEIYPGHPVLRQQVKVKNLQSVQAFVRANDILPYSFVEEETAYRVFRVNQWSVLNGGKNFEPLTTTLQEENQRVAVQGGAGGFQCAWLAVNKNDDRGFFVGWEFDGRADAVVQRLDGRLDLSVNVNSLMHPVEPDEWYEAPAAFIGLNEGDWDEAGYRTQRFAETAIAPPVPDGKFPYLAWDSWGYEKDIHEDKLREEVDLAAQLGVELFIVDLGWARRMGDWEADPKKFPSGMRAFSDYVHSKGMKFGLHFVVSEAMADSQVLLDHPEWACSTNYNYQGAVSLALQHRPVQDWVIEQGVRLIEEYKVDWILQDGQTMVKQCTNTDLSYDARDWNYMGDFALNRIVREIQTRTPGTLWENCANGGNMMTFRMVRNYVTSITNDASGSLGSRQGLYGASFPFPPRYTDRYMPTVPINDYNTRSFMFGGPWILMNKLTEVPREEFFFLKQEADRYKAMRQSVRDGKVLHLSSRPLEGRTDAIQSYNKALDEAIAVVVRDETASSRYILRFRDVVADHVYRVSFADDPRILTMTGRQLMTNGVSVNLPERESGEIVYARPLE